MNKLNADMALLAFLGAIGLEHNSTRRGTNYHTDPSTKIRKYPCVECGDEHSRDSPFCSDKCHQARKEKIKAGKLETEQS